MTNLLKLTCIVAALAMSGGAANAEDELPIEGYPAGRDLPGAPNSPDPNLEYKVAFDLVVQDEDLDDPYPFLGPIAVYVNTLAKFGVPEENRKISVILHRGSGLIGAEK